jgi:transcriptional regulator GlxA family with amidase domain
VFGPNERRTIVAPDDTGLYDALLLAIPRHALGGADDARPSRHDPFADAGKLRRTGQAGLLAAGMCEMMALLRRGHDLGHMAGAASQQLADRLTAALAEAAGRQGLATGSLSQLQRAEAFMEAHAGAAIRMEEVAAAAGLSVRAMQATFRRHRGLTPHQALTRMRLEQVHLRLLRGVPGDRVTDIALQWGFTHLGRFSQTYALRFGKTPASTLRRAQSG